MKSLLNPLIPFKSLAVPLLPEYPHNVSVFRARLLLAPKFPCQLTPLSSLHMEASRALQVNWKLKPVHCDKLDPLLNYQCFVKISLFVTIRKRHFGEIFWCWQIVILQIFLSFLVKIASVTLGNLVCKPRLNEVCKRVNLLPKLAQAELLICNLSGPGLQTSEPAASFTLINLACLQTSSGRSLQTSGSAPLKSVRFARLQISFGRDCSRVNLPSILSSGSCYINYPRLKWTRLRVGIGKCNTRWLI